MNSISQSSWSKVFSLKIMCKNTILWRKERKKRCKTHFSMAVMHDILKNGFHIKFTLCIVHKRIQWTHSDKMARKFHNNEMGFYLSNEKVLAHLNGWRTHARPTKKNITTYTLRVRCIEIETYHRRNQLQIIKIKCDFDGFIFQLFNSIDWCIFK